MITKERVKTAIFIVLWLSFFAVIVGTSPSFQACVGGHYHHEAGDSLQKGATYFIVMSKGLAPCLGEFVHKNAEAIIALFTIILGIATWLLWRATDRLVKGAEITAERQLRAYLVPSGAEIEQIPGGFRMTVALRNTGQTPAFKVRVMSESDGFSPMIPTKHSETSTPAKWASGFRGGLPIRLLWQASPHQIQTCFRRASR